MHGNIAHVCSPAGQEFKEQWRCLHRYFTTHLQEMAHSRPPWQQEEYEPRGWTGTGSLSTMSKPCQGAAPPTAGQVGRWGTHPHGRVSCFLLVLLQALPTCWFHWTQLPAPPLLLEHSTCSVAENLWLDHEWSSWCKKSPTPSLHQRGSLHFPTW